MTLYHFSGGVILILSHAQSTLEKLQCKTSLSQALVHSFIFSCVAAEQASPARAVYLLEG